MENVPLGANEDSRAPWKRETETITVPVTVSITMSKQFEVCVTVDKERFNEDKGIDLTEEELKNAVGSQIILPHEVNNYLSDSDPSLSFIKEDLSGWNVDGFEVINE
jgi:hypothetical protein